MSSSEEGMEEQLKTYLKQATSNDPIVAREAWRNLLRKFSSSNELELSPEKDFAIANGYLPAFVSELNRNPCRNSILLLAVEANAWISFHEKYCKIITQYPGVLKGLKDIAEQKMPSKLGRDCFSCFRSMAAWGEESVKYCLDAGGLDLAISNLHYLDEGEEEFKEIAVTAAQLICRLVGRDESGAGAEAIRNHPKIFEALLWILTAILDTGGDVLDSSWHPFGTIRDVANLCSLERNRPYLSLFIPQLVRFLRTRREHPGAVGHAVLILLQLYSEPRCRAYFEQESLVQVLNQCLADPRVKSDARENILLLQSNILGKPRRKKHLLTLEVMLKEFQALKT